MNSIEKRNSRTNQVNDKLKFKKKATLKSWHKLLFLSPILIILLIFKGNDWYSSYRLSNYGEKTWAKVIRVSLNGVRDEFENNNVELSYWVADSLYFAYTTASVNYRFAINPLNIPLFPEQEYEITFDKENPNRYAVDLSKPDIKTIILYLTDISKVISTLEKTSVNQSECIASEIFRNFGFEGIAHLYFYNEYLVENFKYNKNNFSEFWNKPQIREIVAKCKSN